MKHRLTFGEHLRKCRIDAGVGLRAFATRIGMQPSNLSFIENGRLSPPRDEAILFKIAHSLKLKKGSAEWTAFFDLAVEGKSDKVPADIANDRSMRDLLPVMLRTVSNAKLKPAELNELIDRIKNFRPEK